MYKWLTEKTDHYAKPVWAMGDFGAALLEKSRSLVAASPVNQMYGLSDWLQPTKHDASPPFSQPRAVDRGGNGGTRQPSTKW